jgi:hypothetical protein
MDFLKSIAPWIAAAATGGVPALVGMAANELSEVFGFKVTDDAETINSVVSRATPEQLQAIRLADQQFELKMKELGYDHIEKLEQLAVADRKSAREREIAIKDWTPKVLAMVVTIGYFGVLAYMLQHGVPKEGGEALLVMLGALGGGWGSMLAYYYGSSSGSAAKNELLTRSR